jgi:hypothetical protein
MTHFIEYRRIWHMSSTSKVKYQESKSVKAVKTKLKNQKVIEFHWWFDVVEATIFTFSLLISKVVM